MSGVFVGSVLERPAVKHDLVVIDVSDAYGRMFRGEMVVPFIFINAMVRTVQVGDLLLLGV